MDELHVQGINNAWSRSYALLGFFKSFLRDGTGRLNDR